MRGGFGSPGTGNQGVGDEISVLHVDDDARFAEMAAMHLERASDLLTVETATGGEEALATVAEGAFDCVVSDYEMPGMDGLDLLDAVRADRPGLPFVLFTGKGSEEIASEAISAGVDDYLQKERGTDQFEVLANRVENVAERYRSKQALASSQRRLSMFVDQSPLGVVEWNTDLEAVAMNAAAEEILGYDETGFRGRSWEAIVSESDREAADEMVDRLLSGESDVGGVVETVTKTGEHIICEWHNRVVTDDDGEVVAVFSQFQDVTEREEYRRRLETLISNLPGMVYRCRNEPDWPMEFVGGECEQLTGYPSDAIERDEVLWGDDVIHSEDAEGVWGAVQDAVDEGEPFEVEYRIRTADGDVRWVWERGRGVFDADGPLEALEGFITDVTHRERRERKLQRLQRCTQELMHTRTAEETASTAVEAATDVLDVPLAGVHLLEDGSDTLAPVAAVDRLSETLGEPPVYERASGDPVDAMVWGAFESGQPTVVSDTEENDDLAGSTPVRSGVVHPLGDHGVLVVSATEPDALDDMDLALVDILATSLRAALDRTEREERLRESERDLRRENERLDAFASVVSHDLRNPLNVATGNLESARERRDDEHLAEVAGALDRMQALVDDLLALAREGDGADDREQVHVGSVATDCLDTVDLGDATVEVDADVTVRADRGRLAQVFENLFRNAVEHGSTSPRSQAREDAVEHAGDDPTVTVGALDGGGEENGGGGGTGGSRGFYVADDGPGIPEAERDRVFEAGVSSHEGSGLGLSIVREVAEAHGWTVTVVESETGGARFEVRTGER